MTFNATLWTQQSDVEHCNDGACFNARPDHITYGAAGLRLDMNQSPCNSTPADCCVGSKCANWASGHIATTDKYLYGTYTMRGRPAHSPGGAQPATNVFSCWTPTYVGTPVHNEIAVCFSGLNGATQNIHFSYWCVSVSSAR